MRGQAGFFDVDERLKQLSAKGDNLERLSAVVDFELFRADLEGAVPRSDGAQKAHSQPHSRAPLNATVRHTSATEGKPESVCSIEGFSVTQSYHSIGAK